MGGLKHMPATPMSQKEMRAQCDLVVDACDGDPGEREESLQIGGDRERYIEIVKDVLAHAQSIQTMITDFGVPLTPGGLRIVVSSLHDVHAVSIVEKLRGLIEMLDRRAKFQAQK